MKTSKTAAMLEAGELELQLSLIDDALSELTSALVNASRSLQLLQEHLEDIEEAD